MKLPVMSLVVICSLVGIASGCSDAGPEGARGNIAVDGSNPETSSDSNRRGHGAVRASDTENLPNTSSPLLDVKAYAGIYRSRYPRIFHDDNPDNIIRLQSLGFPTQSELDQVALLTDMELKAKFDSGDARAAIFYSERLADHIEERFIGQGVDSVAKLLELNPSERSNISSLVIDATTAAASGMKFSPSAFSAYNYGRVNYLATGHASYLPASYALAQDLGDTEAGRFLQEMNNDQQRYPADAVLEVYRTMKVTAGR